MKRTFSTVFLFISVVAVGAGLLFFPGAAVQGARKGLSFCGQILIPSIFPFMVLASFLVKSGLAKKIGRHIGAITRFLFYLPGCTGATILVGLIGGYPAGARGIKALVEQGEISPRQGERMLNFSVGAGPAFVITAVGANLLGNSAAGVVLFVSQVAAAVGIGVISGLIARRKGESADPPSSSRRQTTDKIDIATALVDSAADSTAGMLNMSAFVILFSALLAILEQSGAGGVFSQALLALGIPSSAAQSILPILLEVTGGCSSAAQAGASPVLISFALGWAGACVHFQISASLNGVHFSRGNFTLMRLLHGLLAAVISWGFFALAPEVAAEVFASSSPSLQAGFASSPAGCCVLLALCAAFLLSLTFHKNAGRFSHMDFYRQACYNLKKRKSAVNRKQY